MRVSYRLRVFLILSVVLAAAMVAWSSYRYASHAEDREAFEASVERLKIQKTRIDSLEARVNVLDAEVDRDKERLEAAKERIAHYERRAVAGRLPTPDYRRYREAIDHHNDVVAEHNEDLAAVNAAYDEYEALVTRHNALIDSVNEMQRKAVEEGYELPAVELP